METKIYGLYLPYHKSEFLDFGNPDYDKIPEYPVEFRRVRRYDDKLSQVNAYANTPCPASQLIEAESEEEFEQKVKEMDANFQNVKWLNVNIHPYV